LNFEDIPVEEQQQASYLKYYESDQKLVRESVPMMKPLCLANQFDLILLDGSEFTRHAEFKIVEKNCKPKYVAINDLGSIASTKKIQSKLDKWKEVASGTDGPHRWGIFKRLNVK
jgi:hypothetical protein